MSEENCIEQVSSLIQGEERRQGVVALCRRAIEAGMPVHVFFSFHDGRQGHFMRVDVDALVGEVSRRLCMKPSQETCEDVYVLKGPSPREHLADKRK